MGYVVLLLFVLPVVELAVLVQVAGSIGVLDTVGLLVLVSIVGVWLAKRAGLGVLRRLRQAQAEGRAPSREAVDGALVLLAAVLLLLPGFVSDVVGIALLLPPVRALVRPLVLRRLRQDGRVVVVTSQADPQRPDIWDVESWEDPRRARGTSGEIEGPS
jgi:UPF0716 protein FxsA